MTSVDKQTLQQRMAHRSTQRSCKPMSAACSSAITMLQHNSTALVQQHMLEHSVSVIQPFCVQLSSAAQHTAVRAWRAVDDSPRSAVH
eukprot:10164-Heterococcus_DN1.PRE.2